MAPSDDCDKIKPSPTPPSTDCKSSPKFDLPLLPPTTIVEPKQEPPEDIKEEQIAHIETSPQRPSTAPTMHNTIEAQHSQSPSAYSDISDDAANNSSRKEEIEKIEESAPDTSMTSDISTFAPTIFTHGTSALKELL